MVIDFHAHVFPEKIAAKTIDALSQAANIPAHTDGTVSGLLSSMEEGGIDISVNLPVLTKPTQFDSVLAFSREMNKKSYTGARIISFAGVHPDMEEPEEKLRIIKESGFLGIKIHPEYQNKFIDDESYVRILEEAKRLDLITVTHSGVDGAYRDREVRCTPVRVMRLLSRLGGYNKLVLAHLGANEMYDEVYKTIAGEDVYIDTAYALRQNGREGFLRLVEKHGADRVLFASDSPWRSVGEELRIFESFGGLSDENKDKILYKNALSLLGIGDR